MIFNFPANPRSLDAEQAEDRGLPVMALPNLVLFPHMVASLFLSSDEVSGVIESALAGDRMVLAVGQRTLELSQPSFEDLYQIGVEAYVQRVRKMPDGSVSVVLEGRRRMRIVAPISQQPPLRAQVRALFVDEEQTLAVQAMVRAVLSLFEKVVKLSRTLPDDALISALNVEEPGWLADLIASTLPISLAQRQQILETLDPEERLHRISTLLIQELDLLELENRIQTQVQKEVDRSQREQFLREQLKVIQRELGQDDLNQRDLLQLRRSIAEATMPDHARARLNDELDRLENLPASSPEHAIVRNYIDWGMRLPWQASSPDTALNLREASHVLEQHHYGLGRVKDRVLEFLAVRQLAGERHRAPILCLVGPPGVGKTSLGKSIAAALGRPFVRISLGGIHDEAEIRGHRRTYIGALPGRIIQTMCRAGAADPVFMLDEVDKLGADFRGDPSAALLEVLDPEQNGSFSDHYLDLPYDLSRVIFITTANISANIPAPLLDRLEPIDLPGYLEEEKIQIGRRFLVPRQLDQCGLDEDRLVIGPVILREIIRNYTHEAGVRSLDREIGALCRKVARRVAEGQAAPRRITRATLRDYLGPPRAAMTQIETRDRIGAAVGLVYTEMGGDILAIEAALVAGVTEMTLTGRLGEVAREAVRASLTCVRSLAPRFGIATEALAHSALHLHFPEAAIPKDGPSAGLPTTVAIASLLSNRPVRHTIAATGEITIHGHILPVGGVREKILGAYRAGVRHVLIPARNADDIVTLPQHVRSVMTISLISEVGEALDLLLAEA